MGIFRQTNKHKFIIGNSVKLAIFLRQVFRSTVELSSLLAIENIGQIRDLCLIDLNPQEIKVNPSREYWYLNPIPAFTESNRSFFVRGTNAAFYSKCDLFGTQQIDRKSSEFRNLLIRIVVDDKSHQISEQVIGDFKTIPSFEDARLIEGIDKLVGTVVTKIPNETSHDWESKVGILELSTGTLKIFDSPTNKNIEKNWVPLISSQDSLTLVYRSEPLKLLEYNYLDQSIRITDFIQKYELESLSNGSNAIQLENGEFLRVVRKRFSVLGIGRAHFSFWLIHNKDLSIKTLSKPFVFKKIGIEVCNGIQLIEENKLVIAWGEDDRKLFYSEQNLQNILEWIERNPYRVSNKNKFVRALIRIWFLSKSA